MSYFKTCLPKEIAIRSGTLTEDQANFWNTVYTKGLGEFFFRNQIDFRGLIHFPHDKQTVLSTPSPNPNPNPTPKLLVPIGGGKDSTVTAELLKKAGCDVTLLRIGKHPLIEETAKIAGLPLLSVERRLDPLLFRLNANGALNGHVPITAYLSFLSVVIAELYGFDAVVMSNERSASEGNVEYLGEVINHQWSKSLEFERMLRGYLEGIGSRVEYFSLLRPLSELAIVRAFATMPQYFAATTSCNANWKIAALHQTSIPQPLPPEEEGGRPRASQQPQTYTSPLSLGEGARGRGLPEKEGAMKGDGRWCGQCPKCAFAFALFAAFLPEKTLHDIFGKNLFDEESLLPFFRRLLGLEGFKPFECVGTPEETKAAFLLAEQRGDLNDSKAMQVFLKEVKPTIKDSKKLIEECLRPSSDHCIPKPFLSLLPSS